MVGFGYSLWRKKPAGAILITGVFANLITQSFLWVVLNLFFPHYLITLFLAEILIWMIESLLLYSVPANRLRLADAILLSLSMNLASFALGWFLPM
jgi:hypothetical protein